MAPGAAVVEMTVLFIGIVLLSNNRYTYHIIPRGKVNCFQGLSAWETCSGRLSGAPDCGIIDRKITMKGPACRAGGGTIWTAFGRP